MTTVLNAENFQETIRQYCQEHGFNLVEVDHEQGVVEFEMPSGRRQILWVTLYEETLEFSVPSLFAFDEDVELPHLFSSLLMSRNAQYKNGFWCIEEIEEQLVYSLMDNIPAKWVDNAEFGEIVNYMVSECDHMEGYLLEHLDELMPDD